MKNRKDSDALPATGSGPKPADFPLGSVESRAAARAMLSERPAETKAPTIYRALWDKPGKEHLRPKPELYDYETGLPVSDADDETRPHTVAVSEGPQAAKSSSEIMVTFDE